MDNKILKVILSILLAIIIFFIATYIGLVEIFSDMFDYFKLHTINFSNDNKIKNEKLVDIKEINNLYGVWKSIDIDFDNRFEAMITNDSITLYKYENGIKHIYWIGSFDIENSVVNINEKYIINSKNFKYVSTLIDTASTVDNKDFIYDNKQISFISQFNDEYENIVMNRYKEYDDRLRVIKYQGDRESKYNEKDNYTINLSDYIVSVPKYFDNEEDKLSNLIAENNIPSDFNISIPTLNNCIILSPSNTKSYAELFISEIKNVDFEDEEQFNNQVYENSQINNTNNEFIADRILYADDIITNERIYSTKSSTKDVDLYGMSFETYMWMKKTKSIVIIGVAYLYNDTSEYDYLEDYKKVIKNIRRNNN